MVKHKDEFTVKQTVIDGLGIFEERIYKPKPEIGPSEGEQKDAKTD